MTERDAELELLREQVRELLVPQELTVYGRDVKPLYKAVIPAGKDFLWELSPRLTHAEVVAVRVVRMV